MPVPKGYAIDAPVTAPAGYTVDDPTNQLGDYKSEYTAKADPIQQGAIGSFSDASGLTGLGHVLAHPLDTARNIGGALTYGGGDTDNPIINGLKGIVSSTVDNVKQGVSDYKKSGFSLETRRDFGRAVPILGPSLATMQAQQDAGNTSGMLGTMAGTVAGLAAPKLLEGALPAIGRGAQVVGDAAQDSGVGVMNKTIGTLKNDFKRGANPARGYFDTGGGPALSMQGLADQAAEAKSITGKAIPDVLAKSSALTPASEVRAAIQPPLSKAYSLETGPGGTGNTAALDAYSDHLQPSLSGKDMTPSDIFAIKKGIAANTNWSDPSQFNLKAVRQQQVGALSGLLSDKVPEVAPLNRNYGDLTKFVNRAQSRAETGSMPLTSLARQHAFGLAGAGLGLAGGALEHSPLAAVGGGLAGLALDSVPVKSTLASGLYYGGQGLRGIGGKLATVPPFNPAAIAVPGYSLIGQKR